MSQQQQQQKLKVSHHIRKIQEALNVSLSSSDDSSVNLVLDNLLLRYKEYQFESRPELYSVVRTILMTSATATASNTLVSNPTPLKAVASLNQTMVNQYNKSSSKRQLPDHQGDASLKPDTDAVEPVPPIVPDDAAKRRKVATTAEKLKPTNVVASFRADIPQARLDHLAGIDSILAQVQELVFYPIKYPELYLHLGVSPPSGILLHGPSGCGKTLLANAIAGELGLPFFKASGPELVGGSSGESEERVRLIFDNAAANAPSVLFIDGLDVIAGKKDSSQRGMERRIVAQLFDSIDHVASLSKHQSARDPSINEDDGSFPTASRTSSVVLIAATNNPDSIDAGVRGRFAREVSIPVPDAAARTKILELMIKGVRLHSDVDIVALGKLTPGFVGADLNSLTKEAGMLAVSRIVKSNRDESSGGGDATATSPIPTSEDEVSFRDSHVEMNDFLQASKSIQPTAKREGFAVAPDVTWSDIGALAAVREELLYNVLEPIAHPERFKQLGLDVPAGVLFFGPPGCGKTLLAKALANQSGANFISVKGPELLSKYVGESESRVRQVFSRARSSAPCVIFFDELDALCPKRGSGMEGLSSSGGGGGSNGVSDRVVNQLLTELDGLESRRDVYIIAATNRLELIDDAMLRPGRLGKLLYVPLPSAEDRVSILKALTTRVTIRHRSATDSDGVDIEQVARDDRADGFSGADLAALVREAGLAVLKEIVRSHERIPGAAMESGTVNRSQVLGESCIDESHHAQQILPPGDGAHVITGRHFEAAFHSVKPSVSRKDRERYHLISTYIKEGMGAIQALQTAAAFLYGQQESSR